MDRRTITHPTAVALAAFVTVLWSSSWVIIRVGLDGQNLPPILFAGLRYGSAALLLWAATLSSASQPMIAQHAGAIPSAFLITKASILAKPAVGFRIPIDCVHEARPQAREGSQ
jgi:hypothetical protein